MNTVSFYTTKCIVTGQLANHWTGHVVAREETSGYPIKVLAGFCDQDTMNAHLQSIKSHELACFGDWKPEYGIVLDESIYV